MTTKMRNELYSPLMSLSPTVLGLAIALSSFGPASAQDQPRAALPLLDRCSEKTPPPCIDKPPVVVRSPDPAYPKNTQKVKGQRGVVLKVIVGTDGLVHDVQVIGSLGPGFDEEAIKAVRRWTFKPASAQGKPVAASINVQMVFVH